MRRAEQRRHGHDDEPRRVVVDPAGAGFVSLYPAGTVRPLASSLNFDLGRTRANNVTASLNAAGELSVFSTHTAHAVVDVTGYYQ